MKSLLTQLIAHALTELKQKNSIPDDMELPIKIEHTRDKAHGDFACNIAMMLAKPLGKKPRDIAQLIVNHIPSSPEVKDVVIAGPGFINFYIANNAYTSIIPDILHAGETFGVSKLGEGKKINVEFVSANPTGPLHVGHGRGAAYGSAIADLLAACGYDVHREYYVNDAGRQMNILATSVWLRYLQLQGGNITFPSNGYKGEYIKTLAQHLQNQYQDKFQRDVIDVYADVPADLDDEGKGDKEAHIDGLCRNAKRLLGNEYDIVFELACNDILNGIREDLRAFGVEYQEWFSEKKLVTSGAVQHAIDTLKKGGHVFEREGALWFRATDFGDDKDRVIVRENGQTTYFASDAAYLLNKFERGYHDIIYVFGADHHGYVTRLKAAAKALGVKPKQMHIPLVQFATLFRGQEKVQMSTRSGEFVTLSELIDEVGKDASRFFYNMRKREQHMDFDLELAKSQSNDNPVYYVQYAHARICSVMRQLDSKQLQWDKALGLASLDRLTEEHEKALLSDLARYQEIVKQSALNYEPHNLVNYLRELAQDLHTYYNAHQFIVDDAALRNARLCLCIATRQVLANGLGLLAISAPETM